MTNARTTTFLFTDLVGSTEVLEVLGDDEAEPLSRTHLSILREAFVTHGGHEVKSLGDGLMVTFPSASEGVAAAIAMQQGIERYNLRGEGPRLSVRVGLHAGEPIRSGDDYFGLAVVVASRLCDYAEGDQIVTSSVVRELVGRRGKFAFSGLGDVQLKGLTESIKAYSVLWERAGSSATLLAGNRSVPDIDPKQTRVLIVEDESLWASLLANSLSQQPSIAIVGSARDGETAVRLAKELHPAAVLMDIELLGDMDGIEAAIQIKNERPETGIVILSAHSDRRYVTSLPLTENPGWSYLLKQSVPDVATVVRAIEASINGMVMLDPEIVATLRPRAVSALAALAPKSVEVLRLIAEGYTDAAIAARLVISEEAVKADIDNIYRELGLAGEPDVHARVKAAVLFLEETQSI